MAASNKICVVVGLGRGGIGEHCALAFSKAGYKIAMLARTKENLDKLETEIPNSKGFVCDAGDKDQIETAVKAITDFGNGRIDHFIYNAGSGFFKGFDATTTEELQLCLNTGPVALFNFVKAVKPIMLQNGGGSIGVTGGRDGERESFFLIGGRKTRKNVFLLTRSGDSESKSLVRRAFVCLLARAADDSVRL